MKSNLFRAFFVTLILGASAFVSSARAQDAMRVQDTGFVQPESALPDSPGTVLTAATPQPDAALASSDPGSPDRKLHRIVQPGETVVPLTPGDKFKFALYSQFSLTSIAGSLFTAGYGQVTNGRPHYGTDSAAFGERFGASMLNGTTHAVFSYSIYSTLFHEDPRYYVMGNEQSFGKRAIYSASRVVMNGAPDQHSSINWANIAGTATSNALANTYYPDPDRKVSKTIEATLTSLGTQAAVNELHEFVGDIMRKVHHKK